jgi:hypothetical protein
MLRPMLEQYDHSRSHMSSIRVRIIVFPDIASVYVIDMLAYNVIDQLTDKIYFDIQNTC